MSQIELDTDFEELKNSVFSKLYGVLHYKDAHAKRKALDDIDSYILRLPKGNTDMDAAKLRCVLEEIDSASDLTVYIERRILDDLEVIKDLLNGRKGKFNILVDSAIALNFEKVSVEVKRAQARGKYLNEQLLILELESLLSDYEMTYKYIESKKRRLKEKRSDAKKLYAIYLDEVDPERARSERFNPFPKKPSGYSGIKDDVMAQMVD